LNWAENGEDWQKTRRSARVTRAPLMMPEDGFMRFSKRQPFEPNDGEPLHPDKFELQYLKELGSDFFLNSKTGVFEREAESRWSPPQYTGSAVVGESLLN
jgi:hypothetical protein